MTERCPDGFYPRCCPVADCPHYDGIGEGSAPIEPRFVYCELCERAEYPERAVVYVSNKHHYQCWECSRCEVCGTNARESKSDFCLGCFERISAPKPCKHCGELIYCREPKSKHVKHHREQESHLACCRRDAGGKMFRRPAKPQVQKAETP